MPEEQPQIKIPESSGSVGSSPFEKQAEEKFRSIDTLIYAVVVALIISAISALISVGAIIIDQLHFNNQTYRDFSSMTSEAASQKVEIENLKDQMRDLQDHSWR